MVDLILYLSEHKFLSIFLSIILNLIISVIGFIPSTFLTTFNVELFGIKESLFISFIGESLGAAFSFFIYRRGYSLIKRRYSIPTFLSKLQDAPKRKVFVIILFFRLIPFVPSSVVTLYAAITSIKFSLFLISSTIGKLPAIFLEVYSINTLLTYMNMTSLLLLTLGVVILFSIYKKLGKLMSKRSK